MREKGNGNKKSHGAEHVELFIMVGDDRIELVPQRTSFEGAKRRANDRECGCRRLHDRREKKEKDKKKAPRSGSRDAFLWWAITGSNWFRSEHILKEQSDAQNVVSRGCRRLYDCREKREMAIKNPTARSTWNFSLWWAITGSNWFRSEHILKEQSDAQNVVSRGCRRLYDRREKRKKARKKHHGADHVMLSFGGR